MSMTRDRIEKGLNRLYGDLEKAEMANERSACILFGTDSKVEALQAINGEIEYYECLLGDLDEQDEQDGYDLWDEHGFADEADYVRWRYGA